jgi:hypothetical protein
MANVSPKYETYAAGYTKHLKHPNVEKRRKAAKMVGELGVADAIPMLIKLADSDPDAQVRKNARYSLGMFAAFRDATASDNAEKRKAAEEALIGVVTELKVGKPAKPSAGVLQGWLVGLATLFVLLLGANAFLLLGTGESNSRQTANTSDIPGLTNPDTPQQDLITLAVAGQERLSLLLGNTDSLKARLQPAADGGQPDPNADCRFPYVSAEPLMLNPQDASNFAQLTTIYQTLNTTLASFEQANVRALEACDGVVPLTVEEATTFLEDVNTLQEAAPDLETQLQTLATPPTATPAPEDTPAPTLPPTATPDFQSVVGQLYNIIDEVQGQRGANTLLAQYWTDAQNNAGITTGCRQAAPGIPPNYEDVLPEDLEAAPVELRTAINNVNDGLAALRDGWAAFQAACEGGEAQVLAEAATGLQVTDTVNALLSGADQSLQVLRGVDVGGS